MDDPITLSEILQWLLIFMGVSLVLAVLVGVWVWRSVKRLRIPDDATFVEAMRITPLSVVILIDLLDFGLDFLSAPVSWVILSSLGLQKLRAASVVEALIPGTQFLPTMTVAWLGVRFFGPKLDEIPFLQDALNQGANKRIDELERIPKRYRG
jgi:hypothetical protein